MCLVFHSCDQILPRGNLREKRLMSAELQGLQSFMAGKAWRREPEAAGHVAHTVRKQRGDCWCLAHFAFVTLPAQHLPLTLV